MSVFTFALVKTGALGRYHLADIQRVIRLSSLRVIRDAPFGLEMDATDVERFRRLYAAHQGRPYYDDLIASVSNASIAMILQGPNAVATWRTMMGPTDPEKARAEAPQSLRARFGGAAMPDNALHGSDSDEAAVREIAIFFPDEPL